MKNLAYYKICNGFVLICDLSSINSILFLDNQIQNIFNWSNNHKNIFIVVNNNKVDVKNEKNVKTGNLKLLEGILDKYSLRTKTIFCSAKEDVVGNVIENDNDFTLLLNNFNKFVVSCFLNIQTRKSKKKTKKKKESTNLTENQDDEDNVNSFKVWYSSRPSI